MKGLSVLKKQLLLCSLAVNGTLCGDDLGDILSKNQSQIFEYQLEKNTVESEKLSRSWLNPIRLQYKKNYSTQFPGQTIAVGNYAVVIDQPIFKSGGIYYGIKYSQALQAANTAEIILQKRQMIGQAVTLLYSLQKTKLEEQKLVHQIKNDLIDIKQKRESYQAGLLDSSFLDQSILKRSQDETAKLQLEMSALELTQQFALLSDKDPNSLKLPHFRLMSKESYTQHNLTLKRDRLRAKQSDYNAKVTWTKYLPTLSLQGQYIDGDINPLFRSSPIQEKYYSYGFTLSMPIDINAFSDIEASRLDKLKTAVDVLERAESVEEEYDWIARTLDLLEQKIALAKKDEKIYHNLYRVTKNLAHAGEKTALDTEVMYHSLQIRKIDQQIYALEKQIQLLKLYMQVEHAL